LAKKLGPQKRSSFQNQFQSADLGENIHFSAQSFSFVRPTIDDGRSSRCLKTGLLIVTIEQRLTFFTRFTLSAFSQNNFG